MVFVLGEDKNVITNCKGLELRKLNMQTLILLQKFMDMLIANSMGIDFTVFYSFIASIESKDLGSGARIVWRYLLIFQ